MEASIHGTLLSFLSFRKSRVWDRSQVSRSLQRFHSEDERYLCALDPWAALPPGSYLTIK